MSNPLQDLHTLGINPFAVTLVAESMLKGGYATHMGAKPLQFDFPVQRQDTKGWAGVQFVLRAIPKHGAPEEGVTLRAHVPRDASHGGTPSSRGEAVVPDVRPTAEQAVSRTESGGSSYEASMLRNLLARIHRDGGQYVEKHGLDKAVEDAEEKVAALTAVATGFADEEALLRVARSNALATEENHDYLPASCGEARDFTPHQWVMQSMRMSYRMGVVSASRVGGETAQIAGVDVTADPGIPPGFMVATSIPWNTVLGIVGRYASAVTDSVLHESESKKDIAKSSALKALSDLRGLLYVQKVGG